MNLRQTLLFFGIPGGLIYLLFSFLYPEMINVGISVFWATFMCLWTPILALVVIVILCWRKTGKSFREFFWVRRLTPKEIGIVLLAFVIVQIGELTLSFTRALLSQISIFTPPEIFPDMFSPEFAPKIPLETFLGLNVRGNYLLIFLWALWLIVNIGGEELLWRGYALPRMIKYFGKWAWIVNGLLWNVSIHFFMRFSMITLLPISLIVPYLSQKYKSWWPGLIIHGLGNLMVYVILIPSIFA